MLRKSVMGDGEAAVLGQDCMEVTLLSGQAMVTIFKGRRKNYNLKN